MKSFPGALIEAQSSLGSTNSNNYINTFDISRLTNGALNLTRSVPVVKEMLKEQNINISNYQAYSSLRLIDNPGYNTDSYNGEVSSPKAITFENPLMLPSDIIALAKDYDWVYSNAVKSIIGTEEPKNDGDQLKITTANTAIAPSMFNPMYGINILGITRNTPLLNDINDTGRDADSSDCSIRTLCALSKYANSPLGNAKYKYADFMYCKDLGKVSNNHLITLRKFAHPVGDHIFEFTTPKYVSDDTYGSYMMEGDVGRLVAWFGTDDNRLEDICKYTYHASWKPLESKIEEKPGNSEDETQGVTGMLWNTFASPEYAKGTAMGTVGKNSLWAKLATKLNFNEALQGIGKNNELLSNYDNNKVYSPKNTLQSTHIYEGNLIFSHQFTLTFSYQLRAYDNINPRSAMLDLLGNIFEVTYRRGRFWGGGRKIIGPSTPTAPFEKVSNFVDNAWDKMGGFLGSLMNGGFSMENLTGQLGSIFGSIKNFMTSGKASEAASALMEKVGESLKSGQYGDAIKGYIKNGLGRPTLYAWQSLLDGSDVGLWHVTIGNPRNPILSIGNLIIEDTTVQQFGPLGIDDFPSELKVSVTLKHARPRDITDIGRMYTSGVSAIYNTFGMHNLNYFFGNGYPNSASTNGKNKEKTSTKELSKKDAAEYTDIHNNTIDSTQLDEVTIIGNASNSAGILPNVSKQDASPNTGYQLGYEDPFLYTSESVKIARTNNWSNTMFSASVQEVA